MNNELGRGSFGTVRHATHRIYGFECAVKIVCKAKISEHDVYLKLMKEELEVLQSINHINIMRVIQILEDDKHYYVVSEFLRGGELFERIMKNKSYNEAIAADIIE